MGGVSVGGRLPAEELAARAERFVVVGHRGAMAHRPENSLASYALAEEARVDQIELDIRSTADGAVIVLHDATLDRVAGDERGRGLPPVGELTLAQLQEIPLDSGRSVLTFAEACEATTVQLQVEIKDPTCLPAVADYLRANPGHAERMVFTSFQRPALSQARELLPQISRGLIVSRHDAAEPILPVLDDLDASAYYSGWDGLDQQVVREIKDSGRELHAWPIRSREDVERALEWGLDGGTADDPAQLRAWLSEIANPG
ncbi:glycerophosphodiester phosphodiesterase [Pseudactinotalea sp.]|uniref:glycerophosphodiester phosphodiesterase n=1 Tax=Pseudactinotalea sp. TaxID=1926260 RepID=UPI003B3BB5B3